MISVLFATNVSWLGITLGYLVVVALLLHLHERATARFIAHRLGWRGVLLTGWIGVPLHELSHLVMAWLFRHRVIAWKLFDPDPVTGTLGYVRHAPSRDTLFQRCGNFFIGISPLIGGGLALAALLWWALPGLRWHILLQRLTSPSPSTLAALPDALLARLRQLPWVGRQVGEALWRDRSAALALQLYLGACVACHLAPSRADLASALPGALVTTIALVLTALFSATLNLSLGGSLAALPLLTLLLLLSSIFQVLYASIVSFCWRAHHRGQRTRSRAAKVKVVS